MFPGPLQDFMEGCIKFLRLHPLLVQLLFPIRGTPTQQGPNHCLYVRVPNQGPKFDSYEQPIFDYTHAFIHFSQRISENNCRATEYHPTKTQRYHYLHHLLNTLYITLLYIFLIVFYLHCIYVITTSTRKEIFCPEIHKIITSI